MAASVFKDKLLRFNSTVPDIARASAGVVAGGNNLFFAGRDKFGLVWESSGVLGFHVL
jgi:hypothetical protein